MPEKEEVNNGLDRKSFTNLYCESLLKTSHGSSLCINCPISLSFSNVILALAKGTEHQVSSPICHRIKLHFTNHWSVRQVSVHRAVFLPIFEQLHTVPVWTNLTWPFDPFHRHNFRLTTQILGKSAENRVMISVFCYTHDCRDKMKRTIAKDLHLYFSY